MLTNTYDELKYERAKDAREREYISEMALDDELDECTEAAEEHYVRESVDELEEAANMVKKLNVDEVEEKAIEDREINRILNADHDLSFNEMIGIE